MPFVWLDQPGHGPPDSNNRRVINSHAAQIGRDRRRAKRNAVVRNRQASRAAARDLKEEPLDNTEDGEAMCRIVKSVGSNRRELELRLARPPNVPTPRSMVELHALAACHQCTFELDVISEC
jgi:hypothetical protein